MRLSRLAILLACLIGMVLPGVASAAAGKGEGPPAPRFGLFPLEASNGYEAELFTVGNQVLIEAIRGDVGAVYHVRGKVTDG
ncbi:MAG TPA: hypothetical protein VFU04_03755, partial [Solirubrobacterales bacterium]|nr:hypothetical protein [Solirubrobacterales bacterium]